MKRDAATERQVQAAAPDISTWLSANAGSGKTRVLTDRVARLLLNGVPPQRILCLTYTKAAASEMQNRLFRRLGEWAMLEEGKLRDKLRALGLEQRLDEDLTRAARRLFARAIETPGGLKIQTIHSFCAALLRRFPLEAGVSPQFVEMDDRAAMRLREEVLEEMADHPDPQVFDGLARHFTGDSVEKLADEVASHRALFPAAPSRAGVFALFGLPEGLSAQDVLAEVFLGGEADLLAEVIAAMRAGTDSEAKTANRLAALSLDPPDMGSLTELEAVLLFGAKTKSPFGAKIGGFPNKPTQKLLGPAQDRLEDLMRRVEAARPRRLGLMAAEKTWALHRFAATFLPAYAAHKQARGWLDFDDLILKARDLLTDPGVAEWVLYRLDGGIDHILVDEAQDTSPVQWQVIDLLSREFTAGVGARPDTPRTIFVVGDKKQSIYSFQGADPDGFDRMRDQFDERLQAVQSPFQRLELEYSFRSAEPILQVVDLTFARAGARGLGDHVTHRAFRDAMPGRVDLWPLIAKSTDPDLPHWTDPVDLLAPEDHRVQLADRIAAEIKAMLARGETVFDAEKKCRRPMRPGDILVLVQRRSELFHQIIRACKAQGLPIAGADRLKIGGELAVKDLTALLSFLALPEDSLSLAAALRSPLFGWDEDALFRLAAGRSEKYLWETLRNRGEAGGETLRILDQLRRDADFLRPYDLIDRILTRHDGRRKLVARLGEEALDGIDSLLAQALAYERTDVPSLTGFLSWLERDEVEIKRQLDSAGNQLRVMTVHGSKGLEAPVVILPDTGKRIVQIRDEVLVANGPPLWRMGADDGVGPVDDARTALTARQEEERQRLLYVAMTRAEQWLITCAAGDLGKQGTWYEQIADGMAEAGASDHAFSFGTGLRLESGDWPLWGETEPETDGNAAPVPGWAVARAAPARRPLPPLAPSGLGGDKALPGEGAGQGEEAAMRRGTALHLLLEHLPGAAQADWPALAARLLGDSAPDILPEARAVLTDPGLRPLFDRPALCEVAVTAPMPNGRPLQGAIDRLIVGPDRVLAIDYKSNAIMPATPEEVPEGLKRQMGAYAAALAQIYPGRQVDCALLWTRAPCLMMMPSAVIEAALARADLDGAGAAP